MNTATIARLDDPTLYEEAVVLPLLVERPLNRPPALDLREENGIDIDGCARVVVDCSMFGAGSVQVSATSQVLRIFGQTHVHSRPDWDDRSVHERPRNTPIVMVTVGLPAPIDPKRATALLSAGRLEMRARLAIGATALQQAA